jgi:hypothetical protein
MLSWHHESGIGHRIVQIPGGQLLDITMVPDAAVGSWLRIGNAQPTYVPAGSTFELGAAELANCCGQQTCDMWPGEFPLMLEFGAPPNPNANEDPLIAVPDGAPPQSWFVAWRGC